MGLWVWARVVNAFLKTSSCVSIPPLGYCTTTGRLATNPKISGPHTPRDTSRHCIWFEVHGVFFGLKTPCRYLIYSNSTGNFCEENPVLFWVLQRRVDVLGRGGSLGPGGARESMQNCVRIAQNKCVVCGTCKPSLIRGACVCRYFTRVLRGVLFQNGVFCFGVNCESLCMSTIYYPSYAPPRRRIDEHANRVSPNPTQTHPIPTQ